MSTPRVARRTVPTTTECKFQTLLYADIDSINNDHLKPPMGSKDSLFLESISQDFSPILMPN